MNKKLAAWVITTEKSCSQSCFPRSFEYCIFPWTWHPETLSYQCGISRNSTMVTHFIKKQQHWNAKCDRSQCKICGHIKSLHYILPQSGNSIIAIACPLKSSCKEHN